MRISQLPPTLKQIIDVLKDGKPHKVDKIISELGDSGKGSKNRLHQHIKRLNRKFETTESGYKIVAVLRYSAVYYQLFKLINENSITD